jgi:hypothetical protein
MQLRQRWMGAQRDQVRWTVLAIDDDEIEACHAEHLDCLVSAASTAGNPEVDHPR